MSERRDLAREVKRAAAERFDVLRSSGYTGEALQALLARDYVTGRDALNELKSEHIAAERGNERDLALRIHGAEDLRGSAEPHAFAAAYRDAQTRAAEIGTPQDAATMLRRATRSGDALLARAVAARAVERGWGDVYRDYSADHPEWAQAVANASDNRISVGIGANLAYGLRKPPELRRMDDYAIDKLVERNTALYDRVDNPKLPQTRYAMGHMAATGGTAS